MRLNGERTVEMNALEKEIREQYAHVTDTVLPQTLLWPLRKHK